MSDLSRLPRAGRLHRLWLAPLALLLLAAWSVPAAAQETDAEISATIERLMAESKARAAIVRQAKDSVVHISVEKTVENGGQRFPFDEEFFRRFFGPRMPEQPREFKQRGLGSGVIVNAEGYVITNNHVVANADTITVKLPDGREFDAEMVGTDPATDIAVIRIEGEDLPAADLGSSEELQIGESVIAIGNPFGLEQTVTAGIVSAKGRSGVGVTDYEDFIQTDASVNPGNSGGPLINLEGKVVGINTAIFSRSGGNMGIGFAIPIDMSRFIMDQLIDKGKVTRGFLGVVIQDVTSDIAEALEVPPNSGVLIANVGPDSPAQRAGLQQGDLVVSFNGETVKDSNTLRNTVAAVEPGTTVPVTVVRDGDKQTLQVTIGEQPADMQAAFRRGPGDGPPQAAPEGLFGMRLEPLKPSQAEELGYQGMEGLLVTGVERGSPAARAGLREGALIVEANRQPVRSVERFRRIVRGLDSGQNLLLLVRLGEMSRFLVLKKP